MGRRRAGRNCLGLRQRAKDLRFGFCYTQLYDIEQEQNGLYTYDREPKFDMTVFHGINSAKAAIEE